MPGPSRHHRYIRLTGATYSSVSLLEEKVRALLLGFDSFECQCYLILLQEVDCMWQ